MFFLHHGNDIDGLAIDLATRLAEPRDLASALLPEVVLVPHAGLQRWLQFRLAEHNGVAANIRFLRPGELVWSMLRAAAPSLDHASLPEQSPWDAERLRWRLLRGFEDAATLPASLQDYLRVLRALPDQPEALVGQGNALAGLQRYPEALEGWLNVGLLHTAASGRPGHQPYAPCELSTLKSKGYAYWALGHVHRHEILCEDPWVVFPGNLQGRHIRETGPKGAMVIDVDGGQVRDVRFVALDALRWARLVVDVAGATSPFDVFGRCRC